MHNALNFKLNVNSMAYQDGRLSLRGSLFLQQYVFCYNYEEHILHCLPYNYIPCPLGMTE